MREHAERWSRVLRTVVGVAATLAAVDLGHVPLLVRYPAALPRGARVAEPVMSVGYGSGRTLVRGPKKLIDIAVGEKGRHELYDLAADPGERRNLVADGGAAEPYRTRLGELTAWAEKNRATAAEARMTPETEQRVKGLGYVN